MSSSTLLGIAAIIGGLIYASYQPRVPETDARPPKLVEPPMPTTPFGQPIEDPIPQTTIQPTHLTFGEAAWRISHRGRDLTARPSGLY